MIAVGASLEKTVVVTEALTAKSVGSGIVDVYATPMMIALMEGAAAECLAQFLEEGQTSVGTEMCTTHQAATPAGMKVTAKATITAVDGRKVSFDIEARDEKELIGKGTHSRVVVYTQRFEDKAKGKLEK